MGVDVGRDGDVRVAHQLLGHVDGYPCPLQIRAEGMTKTVGGQIRCDGMVDDLAVLHYSSHMKVYGLEKGSP